MSRRRSQRSPEQDEPNLPRDEIVPPGTDVGTLDQA
jgi:hypothetical protein